MKLNQLHEVTYTDQDVYLIPKQIGEIHELLLRWAPKYNPDIQKNAPRIPERLTHAGLDKIEINQIIRVANGTKPATLTKKEYRGFLDQHDLAYIKMPGSDNFVVAVKHENLDFLKYFQFAFKFDQDSAARHYMIGIGLGYPEAKVLQFIGAEKPPIRY